MPVGVRTAIRLLVGSVSVASIVHCFLLTTYSAFVSLTVSLAARTVRTPFAVTPWKDADIVTGVFAGTFVRTCALKVAEVVPGATVTLAGTATREGLELVRLITVPMAAPLVKVTVAEVELRPPNNPNRFGLANCTDETLNGGRISRMALWLTPFQDAVIVTGSATAT